MWWHYVYDNETLASSFVEYPHAWDPEGRPSLAAFGPNWRPPYFMIIFWTVVGAIYMTYLRNFLVDNFFRPFASKYVIAAGYSQVEVIKFTESASRFAFYFPSSLGIIWLTLQKDYFYYPWKIWFIGELPGIDVEVMYNIQMAWYLHQTYVHLVYDRRKKDFWVMLLHHFITLALLLLSLFVGYYRIGLLVLFAHDPCDIFLELGKMTNYLHLYWPCLLSFIGLVISWIVLRLMFYPTLIYTALHDSTVILGEDCMGYFEFAVLLILLQLFHIYWFGLIIKVGIDVARKPIRRGYDWDAREDQSDSDSDGDNDHHDDDDGKQQKQAPSSPKKVDSSSAQKDNKPPSSPSKKISNKKDQKTKKNQ